MKYKCKINNIPLELETIEDNFSKAIVRHEYAGANGSYNEDMGEKARVIKFKTWFIDDLYPKHIDFLNLLSSKNICELHHPIYGIIKGNIENVRVLHQDLINACEIEFDFIEHKKNEIDPKIYIDIVQRCAELYVQSQYNLMDILKNELSEKIPKSIIESNYDSTTDLLGQINSSISSIRNEISKIDKTVRILEGTMNRIANPANSINSLINYGTDIPGRIMNSIAKCIERYAVAWNSIISAPESFLRSFNNSVSSIESSLQEFGKYFQATKSHRMGVEASIIFKIDNENRNKRKYIEAIADSNEEEPYIFTENQLIESVNIIRNELSITKTYFKELHSSDDMGITIYDFVKRIILEYEKTYQIYIEDETPLHLICHKCNLDYKIADRLISINNFKNPNFIKGWVRVYYAG